MSSALLGTNHADKRASRRKPFFRSVRMVMPSGTVIGAPPFDISNEGIGLILDIEIKRGTKARLFFPLPLGPDNLVAIEVAAMCMHSHLSGKAGGFKTGMQFLDVSSQANEAIKAFMDI